MTRLALFICTFGYVGYCPVVPGTVGSVAGLGLWALVRLAESPAVEVVGIAILVVAGVWSAGVAERHLGSVDPGPVVIDEVAGMLITLAFNPTGWRGALLGLVAFRLFDVVKPYPVSRCERLPGGWGIMMDDAMAAIYANLAVRAAQWGAPGGFA